MEKEKKSIFERYVDNLPEEDKIELQQRRKLIEENEFYVTNTMLDVEDKDGKVIREYKQQVKIYKDVKRNMTVSTQLLLSFGGYREYTLDQRFLNKMLKKFKEDNEAKFCIDMGARTFVKNSEMVRVLEEGYNTLTEKKIHIDEDINKDFRESEMGKMIEEMGMMI